jgi:hypothetical protein
VGSTPTLLTAIGADKLVLKINKNTGFVTGSLVLPDTTTKAIVTAVVFQAQSYAGGNFTSFQAGGNASGLVKLTNP